MGKLLKPEKGNRKFQFALVSLCIVTAVFILCVFTKAGVEMFLAYAGQAVAIVGMFMMGNVAEHKQNAKGTVVLSETLTATAAPLNP